MSKLLDETLKARVMEIFLAKIKENSMNRNVAESAAEIIAEHLAPGWFTNLEKYLRQVRSRNEEFRTWCKGLGLDDEIINELLG